jgi:hypothetical protein
MNVLALEQLIKDKSFDPNQFVFGAVDSYLSKETGSIDSVIGRFLLSLTLKDLSMIIQITAISASKEEFKFEWENDSQGIVHFENQTFRIRIAPIDLDLKLIQSIDKWKKLEGQITK